MKTTLTARAAAFVLAMLPSLAGKLDQPPQHMEANDSALSLTAG